MQPSILIYALKTEGNENKLKKLARSFDKQENEQIH